MAAGPHTFVVADVFASERYLGNQLAIVSIRSNALSYQQKRQIAKEFNHSTTAFLHDSPHPYQPRKLELFSSKGERHFAADAVLGTAQYIFQCLATNEDATALPSPNIASGSKPGAKLSKCALQTKSGVIHAFFDPARQVTAIEVPFDIHVHAKETSKDEILAVQRKLGTSPQIDKMKASYSVVSIYEGVTFTLVDFTNCPTLISLLQPSEAPEPNLDAGWRAAPVGDDGGGDSPSPSSFYGAVYFIQLQTDFTEEPYITRLEARVIADGVEEAASASGCCALAAHLAMQKGGKNSRHAYAIEQGIEMGRKSQLCIEVRLNEQGSGVSRITLSGRATMVMEGKLL
ncbi:hypothetical protein D8B26_001369 [Coccidioides posadasii str. Silveira]|uniref:Uncharacterized protein n=2 Tax=Coccidioides posadasii TaxID=199306 RepID=E9D9Q9_COCPS|nr:conserved hypothetical protein [Coccidioides posadasii str. Silveira]KMM64596.1 hypothetical protein CPAG_00948 [Coccidioides posadasii RMSCC 3488]QVM06662.1 hypothetical protein D8B26_001369 [Coccidioides posadasii str. Silveira]